MISDELKRDARKLERVWTAPLREVTDFMFLMERKSAIYEIRSSRPPSDVRGYRHLFYHPVTQKPYDLWEDKYPGGVGAILPVMKELSAKKEGITGAQLLRLEEMAATAGYMADSLVMLSKMETDFDADSRGGHIFDKADIANAAEHAKTLQDFTKALDKHKIVGRFIEEGKAGFSVKQQESFQKRLNAQLERRDAPRIQAVSDPELTARVERFVEAYKDECNEIDAAFKMMSERTWQRRSNVGPRDEFKWRSLVSGPVLVNHRNKGGEYLLRVMEAAATRPQGVTIHELNWMEELAVPHLDAMKESFRTLIDQYDTAVWDKLESGKVTQIPFDAADVEQVKGALKTLYVFRNALTSATAEGPELLNDLSGNVRAARLDIGPKGRSSDKSLLRSEAADEAAPDSWSKSVKDRRGKGGRETP